MRCSGPAICLDVRDYSETSQIIHLFTLNDGAVSLIAKGAKRKKSKSGGAIDLFFEGEVVYIQKKSGTLGTLVEFSETVSHSSLRSDIRRLYTAMYAIELVNKLIADNDPHPRVFSLLSNALLRLGDSDAPLTAVLAYFMKQVLVRVGLLGEIEKCVDCFKDLCVMDNPVENAFYAEQVGGLLCSVCARQERNKVMVKKTALEGLGVVRSAETGRGSVMSKSAAFSTVVFLDQIVTNNLGRRLRMSKHIVRRRY